MLYGHFIHVGIFITEHSGNGDISIWVKKSGVWKTKNKKKQIDKDKMITSILPLLSFEQHLLLLHIV